MSYKASKSISNIVAFAKYDTELTISPSQYDIEDGGTITFTGHLRRSDTETPISGATINFYLNEIYNTFAVTNSDGFYTKDLVFADPIRYHVEVRYQGT